MERVAVFEKISKEEFETDYLKLFPEDSQEHADEIHEQIHLPKRATAGSAGYDFYAPYDIDLAPGAEILIPTGIRAKINSGYVLLLFPRSSLGFKYRLQLNNTVGVIDADYYHADNEGHIFCKLTNDTLENKTVHIASGAGMVQGIFMPFGITEDDQAEGERTGGFGSTNKEETK